MTSFASVMASELHRAKRKRQEALYHAFVLMNIQKQQPHKYQLDIYERLITALDRTDGGGRLAHYRSATFKNINMLHLYQAFAPRWIEIEQIRLSGDCDDDIKFFEHRQILRDIIDYESTVLAAPSLGIDAPFVLDARGNLTRSTPAEINRKAA